MDYLPLFVDLRSRLVLVVGGGEIAWRKVQLLQQAQAHIRLVAPTLDESLRAQQLAGRIDYRAAEFDPAQLEGVMLVIAATDRPEVNRAVAETARARGLWVNVVDDAGASSVIMPSIIDRSPLVVAIGTGGSSPTLARRVRAQMEALLPQRLGDLAQWAGSWRERVRQVLPQLPARRRFWDRVFDGPVASQFLAGHSAEAQTQFERLLQRAAAAPPRGEVYLIGAGPGDPDLLTLRALQLMQQCDVVLYDRLVSDAVLQRVRREAQRIFVGKQSGHHRVTQQRIHELLVEYAGQGLRVARLKGGDPAVFARGGEELEALRQAGIPVVIVPGVTAALGAAAAVGISLTHRGLSQSITLVTAMGEGSDALDWRSLAAPMQTVILYMGVAQLPRIVQHLQAHGAPSTRPVAIVERATLPQQRLLCGTLADIVSRAEAVAIAAPALLIVGEVAAHATALAPLVESFALLGIEPT